MQIKACFYFTCGVMVIMVCARVYPYLRPATPISHDGSHSMSMSVSASHSTSEDKDPAVPVPIPDSRHDSSHSMSMSVSAHNRDALLECYRKGEGNKASRRNGTTTLLTLPEFYAPGSLCLHNFKATVAFFLLGKAGAGTIRSEVIRRKFKAVLMHPDPEPLRFHDPGRRIATIVVNVRDPVDRFVSAFRWRLAVLCHPDDTRNSNVSKGAAQNPHERCKARAMHRAEERLLRETYRSDPNALAEALCEGARRAQAATDYASIGHSETLSQWLDILIAPDPRDKAVGEGIQRVMALPLEAQGDDAPWFEEHLWQLLLHLLQGRYGEAAAAQMMQQTPREKSAEMKDRDEHSSAKFHNATNSTLPTTLSPLGECCLTRHLREDYRLIHTMLGEETGATAAVLALADAPPALRGACAWGSAEQRQRCRADLQSMLSRRARYLDVSQGTCLEVS